MRHVSQNSFFSKKQGAVHFSREITYKKTVLWGRKRSYGGEGTLPSFQDSLIIFSFFVFYFEISLMAYTNDVVRK